MNHNLKSIYNICIEQGFIKDIEYKTFANIVKQFHKDISLEVQLGYRFQPNGELGTFNIIRDIRRGRTIDWGASNKFKQKILDNGGIPFNKETAPNGEEWFIYFEDNNYYKWKWFKRKPTFIKNLIYYMFKPSSKNRRTISQVIKDNPLAAERYGVYKQSSIV
jgi:hypothetical protein